MSTIKHTPGPWSLENHSGHCDYPVDIVLNSDSSPVASVYGKPNPERTANARLIAAAPELLEALRECITEDGAVAWRNAQFAGQRLEAISNIAKAAIAKAEGTL